MNVWLIRICGILTITAAVALIFLIMRGKQTASHGEAYDERQKLERLKAAHAGFLAMLAGTALFFVVSSFSDEILSWARLWMCAVLVFGVGIYAVYAIFSDAFLSLKQKPGWYLGIVGLALLGNGIGLIPTFADGTTFLEAIQSSKVVSFAIILLFLIIGIALIIKMLIDRREHE